MFENIIRDVFEDVFVEAGNMWCLQYVYSMFVSKITYVNSRDAHEYNNVELKMRFILQLEHIDNNMFCRLNIMFRLIITISVSGLLFFGLNLNSFMLSAVRLHAYPLSSYHYYAILYGKQIQILMGSSLTHSNLMLPENLD